MTFEVTIGGRSRLVTVEPIGGVDARGGRFRLILQSATGDPAAAQRVEVDARLTDLGVSVVSLDEGRVFDAAVTERPGGGRLVQLPHVDIDAFVGSAGRRGAGAGGRGHGGEQRISAPMPGRVLRVLVQPGDRVTVRQGLVVVEAMKMENELTAPCDGVIRDVHVAPGASVEAGRVLIVLEESGGPPAATVS